MLIFQLGGTRGTTYGTYGTYGKHRGKMLCFVRHKPSLAPFCPVYASTHG